MKNLSIKKMHVYIVLVILVFIIISIHHLLLYSKNISIIFEFSKDPVFKHNCILVFKTDLLPVRQTCFKMTGV